jgi:hypothetical protein
MPTDSETYRGFEVVWDVRPAPDGPLWKGQAAVVLPADAAGINYVHGISGDAEHFTSSAQARRSLVRAAKQWIDNRLERESREHRDSHNLP